MSTVSAPSITMVNVPTSCRPQYIQGFGARSYIRAVGTVMPESSHCPSTAFVATVFPLLHQECLARPRPHSLPTAAKSFSRPCVEGEMVVRSPRRSTAPLDPTAVRSSTTTLQVAFASGKIRNLQIFVHRRWQGSLAQDVRLFRHASARCH